MTTPVIRPRLIAALSVLIGVAACSNSGKPDDELQKDLAAVTRASSDLQLAPTSAQSRLTVSPIEGGPSAVPAPSPHRAVTKAVSRPVTRKAVSATTPRPAPREVAPAPREVEPPPLPPARQAPATRQKGTYKTEAEVFRQMPWIKP